MLQDFDSAERAELSDVITRAIDAAMRVVTVGIAPAMNVTNEKPKKKK